MNRSLYRSWSVGIVAVIAALVVSIGVASAHAHLKSSVPAADSTVASAPTMVTAVFENHNALVAEGSVIAVTDAAGKVVDNGDTTLAKSDADRKTLTVSLKSGLANGVYTVKWTAASEGDGSKEEGSFTFTVGAAAATAPATTAPSSLPQTGASDSLPWAVVSLAVILVGLGLFARRFAARSVK